MENDNAKEAKRRRRNLIVCLLFVFLAGGIGTVVPAVIAQTKAEEELPLQREAENEELHLIPDEALEAPVEEESPEILVYVCGAVANEGVYVLPEGARVSQALEAAGGFLPEANTQALNLAAVLSDAVMVRVPYAEEAENGSQSAGIFTGLTEEASDGKVNLNSAGMEDLMTLPGIGEAKAAAILAYREEHGAFTSIEEIMNVSGIKTAGFAKIREKITVQ